MHYKLPVETLNKVVTYLESKPYSEVHKLVELLGEAEPLRVRRTRAMIDNPTIADGDTSDGDDLDE